jgi:hypothetical protein
LIVWTGSTEVSIVQHVSRKCPFCHQHLDSRHYFLCGNQTAYQLSIVAMAREKQWEALLKISVDTYFRYLFRLRPSILSEDEGLLLDC